MSKVLLTGGSGFIATHVLELLLERGYSVITTVRSHEKGKNILDSHPSLPRSRLDYCIVEDIAKEGAFDDAVKIEGLETVVHTASPFHFNVTDTKKDLLDPAVIGTTSILKAIKKNAPTVKKVVITSSFAAIVDVNKPENDPNVTYTEKVWNTVTEDQASLNPKWGYRASKTFAERAAWEFMEKEAPGFTLTTVNPPLVFGPVLHHLTSLSTLNTSNQKIRDLITGMYKDQTPEKGVRLWIDVRDVALAHVKALELDAAAGQRLFITPGYASDTEIVNIIRQHFPECAAKLPVATVDVSADLAKAAKFDNSVTNTILQIKYYSLEQSIIDTVKSLSKISS